MFCQKQAPAHHGASHLSPAVYRDISPVIGKRNASTNMATLVRLIQLATAMLIGSALAWDKARRRRSTERFETLPAPCVQWTTASACGEPQHSGEFSELSEFWPGDHRHQRQQRPKQTRRSAHCAARNEMCFLRAPSFTPRSSASAPRNTIGTTCSAPIPPSRCPQPSA